MAAGGITYDMVLPRRVTTLPSVESWGTNMNILKDPPKSIHTRRIDKVGDTQQITIDIDGAGDRICEMINVYGRGINQMVGVNYSNNGTNGGQNRQTPTVTGTVQTSNCTAQASLPYKAFDNGAFRPPVQRQENLLPLSRMPRVWTYAATNKAFPNNVQQMTCHTEQNKSIKSEENLIRSNIRPTATYNLGPEGVSELNTDKYIIPEIINVEVGSGTRTLDRSNIEFAVPLKEIAEEMQHIEAYTNLNSLGDVEIDQLDTRKYIQDSINTEVYTNANMPQNHIDQYAELDTRKFIKDPLNYEVNSGANMQARGGEYIHSQKNNRMNRPIGEATTNKGGYTVNNIENSVVLDKEILNNPYTANKGDYCKDPYANTNRGANLLDKISAGSFVREGHGKISNNRTNQVYENSVISDRQLVQKKAFNSFFKRYQQ